MFVVMSHEIKEINTFFTLAIVQILTSLNRLHFEISCLSVASFAIIFSHSEGCLFTLLIVCFVLQKLVILIRSHLFIFAFISSILGGG